MDVLTKWKRRGKCDKIKEREVGRMQLQMHMVTIEDLVPQGHFLRKLESVLDARKRLICITGGWGVHQLTLWCW